MILLGSIESVNNRYGRIYYCDRRREEVPYSMLVISVYGEMEERREKVLNYLVFIKVDFVVILLLFSISVPFLSLQYR
jgi:hypothetical protein